MPVPGPSSSCGVAPAPGTGTPTTSAAFVARRGADVNGSSHDLYLYLPWKLMHPRCTLQKIAPKTPSMETFNNDH
jgi:hypothetical protein